MTPVHSTPRTDEQVAVTNRKITLIGCGKDGGMGEVDAVTADFARQLERELSGDWIPVTERLPDDDLMVMVATQDSDEPVWLGYHDGEGWHFADAMPAAVTDWKPMPVGPR